MLRGSGFFVPPLEGCCLSASSSSPYSGGSDVATYGLLTRGADQAYGILVQRGYSRW
jgi:hypothetical protein